MYRTTDGEEFENYRAALLHQAKIDKAEHERERRELWKLEAKEQEPELRTKARNENDF